MQNFYNSLVMAVLGPQANPNDPEVALSPQLLYTYKSLVNNQTDLAKAYRASETKQKLAELKNIVTIYSTAQKAQTSALGEIAQSSRVSSQNITKLKDGALKTLERASSKQSSMDRQKYREIIEAGEGRAKSNNLGKEQNTLYEATLTRFVSTDPVDPDNTKALGTISAILNETVGATLDDNDIVAKVREYTKDSPYQGDIVEKIAEYKAAHDDLGNVIRKAESMTGSLNEYGKELDGVTAGAAGSKEQIKKANDTLKDALLSYGSTLQASEDAARASAQDVRAFYEDYLTASAQYEEVLQSISDKIIGRDRTGEYRGRLVSEPNFIAWAKDNGYENLGYMRNGRYVEGADDTRAIYTFQWQQKHPDRYKPGFGRLSPETDDLLVIEKAPSQKYLDSLMTSRDDSGNPTYLFKLDKNGNKKFLKKDDPFFLLMAEGGTRIESTDNQNLMVNFKTSDLFNKDSDLYKALKEREALGELTDEADKDITVEDMAGYLSSSQNPKELDARTKDVFNAIMGDTQLVQALGVRIVDIDGTVRPFKNTEELEAAIEGYDANKDKTYKRVLPNDADTFFGMTPEIDETSDLPTEKRVVERQRMHAAKNFTKDGVVVIGTDADGEVKFDPSGKDGFFVAESYDTSDLGGRVNVIEDPAKRLTAAKIKMGKEDPDELKSEVQFEEKVETDEEQKEREEQSVLGMLRQSAGKLKRDEMRALRFSAEFEEATGVAPDYEASRPLLLGRKARRQQEKDMQEEAAKEKAEALVGELGDTPASVSDLPVLQPFSGGLEQFGVALDPTKVPARVQRKLRQGLPSAAVAGLPRLSPLDKDVESTQRIGEGLPSAFSGPASSRLKVPTAASREFLPYDRSFGSELTPMSERSLGAPDILSGMFAPELKGQSVKYPSIDRLRQLENIRRNAAKLKALTPRKTVEEVTVPEIGVGSDEVTILSGDK